MSFNDGIGYVRYGGKNYDVILFNKKLIKRKYSIEEIQEDSLYSIVQVEVANSENNIFKIKSQSLNDIEIYINDEKQELNGVGVLTTKTGSVLQTLAGDVLAVNNFSKYELRNGTNMIKVSGNFRVAGCPVNFGAITLGDSLTNLSKMFADCENLTVAPAITQNAVNCEKMFFNCTNLVTLPQKNIDLFTSNAHSITNTAGCYTGCVNINCVNNNYLYNGLPRTITYDDIPDSWK